MSIASLHSYIPIYSKLILFTDSKHVLHFLDSLSKLQIQSKRLVMMSVSLRTETGLHCLTIQVLNTRVCFIDIWYTSLTSVHYNLEDGLAIMTESFSALYLDYITSFVKVQTRGYVTSHTMPDTVFVMYTKLAQNGLDWLQPKLDADVMH